MIFVLDNHSLTLIFNMTFYQGSQLKRNQKNSYVWNGCCPYL